MSLPRFSVRNPVLVNLLMLVIIAAGLVSALTLTREMFPESRTGKADDHNHLSGGSRLPGIEKGAVDCQNRRSRAATVERRVDKSTRPILEGLSSVRLSLLPGTRDVDRVLQEVKAEIDAIQDPCVDAEKSTIRKLEPRLPVIAVAVFGPGSDADRKRAARTLRDELLQLPGVSDVDMNGAKDDEISVEIRPTRLMEYDITFDEVAASIRQANLDVTGARSMRRAVRCRSGRWEKNRARSRSEVDHRSQPGRRPNCLPVRCCRYQGRLRRYRPGRLFQRPPRRSTASSTRTRARMPSEFLNW